VIWCSDAEYVLCQHVDTVSSVTILIFGDVNLGRQLGQELLKGNLKYPFDRMQTLLRSADCVFANLESPISDQHGETESPRSNYVFCAPPVAARVLRQGGVTIVSTANNHALDYSLDGLRETVQDLDTEGVLHVGTSADSVARIAPTVVRRDGIRVGFLAYTQFVNAAGPWKGRLAIFDSIGAGKDIRRLKRKADIVVVSFHGGTEYSDKPDDRTQRQLECLVRAGADIVVCHHPHVPQGIDTVHGSIIFYSLGNFVFNQTTPWAKRSFGVELKMKKKGNAAFLSSVRLIPFRAYKQPATDLTPSDVDSLVSRVRALSNVSIVTRNDSIFVSLPHRDNSQ